MEKIQTRTSIILSHLNNVDNNEINFENNNVKNEEDIVTSKSISNNQIILITLKNLPVNALSDKVLSKIRENLLKAYENSECKAVIFTSAIKGFFVAGIIKYSLNRS
jgi:enoyl-CoA hydratase/carnithine racemase